MRDLCVVVIYESVIVYIVCVFPHRKTHNNNIEIAIIWQLQGELLHHALCRIVGDTTYLTQTQLEISAFVSGFC